MSADAQTPKPPRTRKPATPKNVVPELVATIDPTTLPLMAKIAAITTEINPLPRRLDNTFHEFPYTPIEDVKRATAPLMAKYGVVIIPSVKEYRREGTKTVLILDYQVTDGKETFTVGWVSEGNDKGDFGVTKALSFAIKYFLINLFQIALVNEADGDSGANSETPLIPLNNQILAQYRTLHPTVKGSDKAILAALYGKAGVKKDEARTITAAATVFAMLFAKGQQKFDPPVAPSRMGNPTLDPNYPDQDSKYGVPESELEG